MASRSAHTDGVWDNVMTYFKHLCTQGHVFYYSDTARSSNSMLKHHIALRIFYILCLTHKKYQSGIVFKPDLKYLLLQVTSSKLKQHTIRVSYVKKKLD